jgi:hypothetical protein
MLMLLALAACSQEPRVVIIPNGQGQNPPVEIQVAPSPTPQIISAQDVQTKLTVASALTVIPVDTGILRQQGTNIPLIGGLTAREIKCAGNVNVHTLVDVPPAQNIQANPADSTIAIHLGPAYISAVETDITAFSCFDVSGGALGGDTTELTEYGRQLARAYAVRDFCNSSGLRSFSEEAREMYTQQVLQVFNFGASVTIQEAQTCIPPEYQTILDQN